MCGCKSYIGNLPIVGTSAPADTDVIAELVGRAYRFLKVQNLDNPAKFEELQVASSGRAYRPATPSGRPMTSAVPPDQLSGGFGYAGSSGNVFLCWGHGSYGITLGPGTGKLMSQIIQGIAPDIDLSPYKIPVV